MRLFIIEHINSKIVFLNEEESKHISRVLRMNTGDTIHLTDGKGTLCEAKIIFLSNKKCEVEIVSTINNFEKRDYYLHLAVCPTKSNDRFEWFLEKATEIGIDEITILIGENSERRKFNTKRYQKIILSAVKQSLKAYIPKLNDPIKVTDFILKNDFEGSKMIAHCDTQFERKNVKSFLEKKSNTLIMIGPEGDFSPSEIQLAYQTGFSGVSLSNSRLRTETAGIVATDYVSYLNF
ncbi:16S rRNA (uracil(1498)-N(3))-methyltransferase [Flavobacteriaceae bacterium UJ101]|nr:16S rRNA (uracil(1498)-N(3))-methyltransferase [Flavobacteriaceae bacterium UJ101]